MRFERPRFHRACCLVWPRRYGPHFGSSVTPSPDHEYGRQGKSISLTAAAREIACNDPTGGSSGRRRCRFPGRLGANPPAAV